MDKIISVENSVGSIVIQPDNIDKLRCVEMLSEWTLIIELKDNTDVYAFPTIEGTQVPLDPLYKSIERAIENPESYVTVPLTIPVEVRIEIKES